jgi:hypothetical protein
MVLQVLSPDMQNAQHTNIGSQVLEVASDLVQRCGTGATEQIVWTAACSAARLRRVHAVR